MLVPLWKLIDKAYVGNQYQYLWHVPLRPDPDREDETWHTCSVCYNGSIPPCKVIPLLKRWVRQNFTTLVRDEVYLFTRRSFSADELQEMGVP
jgi:hypothetical protein